MTKKVKIRLDEAVLRADLSANLQAAQALILAGKVLVDGQRVDKVGTIIQATSQVSLKGTKKYVSRAGEKLESAILALGVKNEFKDRVVVDIGASTGGFTHCVLQFGASLVFAVEAGFNQFSAVLKDDPRVRLFEQTDIRDFIPPDNQAIDWVVADVSFVSLVRLSDSILALGGPKTRYLLLVKPQFELEKGEVPAGGVVLDEGLRAQAVKRVRDHFEGHGLSCLGQCDSAIMGRRGNLETFVLLARKG